MGSNTGAGIAGIESRGVTGFAGGASEKSGGHDVGVKPKTSNGDSSRRLLCVS
jgi:hypothetical protein